MRLLNDPQVQTSTCKQFTNPIYATLFHELDYMRVTLMLQSLSTVVVDTSSPSSSVNAGSTATGTAAAGTRSSNSSTAVAGLGSVLAPAAGCWVPADWVDILEPFVGHLVEVLRRFRGDGAWEQNKAGELDLPLCIVPSVMVDAVSRL